MSSPTLEEQVKSAQTALLESVVHVSIARVKLDAVRSDTDASAEKISQAAVDFRNKEGIVGEALGHLMDLQCKALASADVPRRR